MDESEKAKIKNALMVALQPFHAQKFITLTTTIAGWNLLISKNCMASNSRIEYIRKTNCCNTVTKFIKAFNSAIARVYNANGIPIGTPLRNFVGMMPVSIDANFFNSCMNSDDDPISTTDDVNVFVSLIGKNTNDFEAFQFKPDPVGEDQSQDPSGGRNHRRRSSRRKYSKRRSSRRKYSKRR